MKIGFVSLGCSKNLVDTEKTIGIFKANDYEIVNTPEKAEVIVINTCGFIESAKEEAINTILEMAEYKKQKCKYLIAMGCLVERYKEELEKAIPEVDLYIKYSEYNMLWVKIQALLKDSKTEKDIEDKNNNINEKTSENKYENFDDIEERVVSTGANFAYLKIADGCSNRCTYCAIPYIRGPQMSRKMEDILKEAKKLASSGYKELIVIAQDTTKYGIDIYGEPKLAELLDKISKIDSIKWIRFLYAYPETITPDLIKLVKENDKICKYFDIPIQHISDTVLKRMNRQSNGKTIRNLIQTLRKEIPNVVIRTTVMVGFPGETKEDFEELYNFLKEARFDKLGCFAYSKEEGTPAARIKEQIHPMTKKSRYNKIMSLQQEISKENLQKQIGKEVEILIEGKSFDGRTYVGRTYMDVPDIDGIAYLNTDKNLQEGDFVKAKIIDVSNYDLICKEI
jgi:ribosomal protein S12 methylthiotransferase